MKRKEIDAINHLNAQRDVPPAGFVGAPKGNPMTQDTNTTSGAAIQRYKIGYRSDEWGVRSSTPSGIPDASGSWVRYEDHAAEFQRLHACYQELEAQVIRDCMSTQQGAADGFFLLLPQRPKPEAPAGTAGLDWDAYSGAQMLAFGRDCSDAAIAALRTQQPAPAGASYEKALEEALRERDDADDFIDALLDEVLGTDRAEWSSAYGRADALEEVRERITALHKPAVDRAWKQFEAATQQAEVRPVTPYTCPKCHALWLHWPAEQSGFGMDTLNCRSTTHCDYCEKGGVEQLERLERVPAALKAQQQEAQEPFAWHVCSVNSDGSLSLEHAAAWEEAAHEHINDAITEHDIEGAGSWVVRPAYHAPQPSLAAQAAESVPAGPRRKDMLWSTVKMQERHDQRIENIVSGLERIKQEHAGQQPQKIDECYGDCPTDSTTCTNPCRFDGRAAQEGKSHDN